MTDLIVGAVLLFIVGGAAYYLYSQKKKGVKCVGCPHSSCPSSTTAQGEVDSNEPSKCSCSQG